MDIVENEHNYKPTKYVCERLDISDSTLRKWCIQLEANGYEFTRTTQNRRLYVEKDLELLELFKQLVQKDGLSLENAAIIATSRYNVSRSSPNHATKEEEKDSETLTLMQEHIEKQEQFNRELVERLDKQNEYINKRLDQRDKTLMETMNKLIEQREEQNKLLEEVKKEQKKGFFSRLFGKK